MSAKITIVEGNSNDKDNVRNFMVKGEPGNDGVSPTVSTSKSGSTATINITDAEGTHSFDLTDGFSPIITSSKNNGVTTLTILDTEGVKTATINDGEVTAEQLNTALANYKLNGDFAVITGTAEALVDGSIQFSIPYPTGFNASNCVVLSFMAHLTSGVGVGFGYGYIETASGYVSGAIGHSINLGIEMIDIHLNNPTDGSHTSGTGIFEYKIVLMKIS